MNDSKKKDLVNKESKMNGFEILVGGVVIVALGAYVYKKVKDASKLDEEDLKGIFYDTIDIANLTVKDISSWFKTKISDINQDNKVCVVSYFRSDLLKGYNIKLDETVNTANKLLQFIYDENASKIVISRMINFDNIDTNLQAKLEENNGLIVLTI